MKEEKKQHEHGASYSFQANRGEISKEDYERVIVVAEAAMLQYQPEALSAIIRQCKFATDNSKNEQEAAEIMRTWADALPNESFVYLLHFTATAASFALAKIERAKASN